MPSADPDAVNMLTPLGRLLTERMAAEGWHLRDVVRPPDGTRKGAPARSTFSHYLQPGGWLQTLPRPKAITELATAVRVREDVIRDAAYRSLASERDKVSVSGSGPGTVGPSSNTDEVRLQRPPGISDQEWARLRRTAEATLEALFDQYARGD